MASRTLVATILATFSACYAAHSAAEAATTGQQPPVASASNSRTDVDSGSLSVLHGINSRPLSDAEKVDTNGQRLFMQRVPGLQRMWIIPKKCKNCVKQA